MAIPRPSAYGDHQQFSESICSKVHQGLRKRTKGNALAILARAAPCTGFELSDLERFELEQVAKSKS